MENPKTSLEHETLPTITPNGKGEKCCSPNDFDGTEAKYKTWLRLLDAIKAYENISPITLIGSFVFLLTSLQAKLQNGLNILSTHIQVKMQMEKESLTQTRLGQQIIRKTF